MKVFLVYLTSLLLAVSCGKNDGADNIFVKPLDSEIGMEVECVVDGMKFIVQEDTKVYEFEGKRYYLCGMGNEIEEFRKNPMHYIKDHKNGKDHQIHQNENTNTLNTPNSNTKKDKRIVYYRGCSMYPDYISDSPGKCPAGMDLIPVYEDEIGTLTVDDSIASSLGFKLSLVKPTNIYVNLPFPGRIVSDTELYNLLSEYLSVLKTFGRGSTNALNARKRLHLLGYEEKDINDVEKSDVPDNTLIIPSDYAWGIVYIPLNMLKFVSKGGEVIVNLGETSTHGRVMFISKLVDKDTFTVPARIRIVNKEAYLRPQMYFKAEIKSMISGLIIDRRSIIDTGKRRTVYIYYGSNTYVARNVNGYYVEDFFVVEDGLKSGDIIVVNGNSLLDAQAELIGIFRLGNVK